MFFNIQDIITTTICGTSYTMITLLQRFHQMGEEDTGFRIWIILLEIGVELAV